MKDSFQQKALNSAASSLQILRFLLLRVEGAYPTEPSVLVRTKAYLGQKDTGHRKPLRVLNH